MREESACDSERTNNTFLTSNNQTTLISSDRVETNFGQNFPAQFVVHKSCVIVI